MSFIDNIKSIPNIMAGIFMGFLAIIVLRVTSPLTDAIFSIWEGNSIIRIAATLTMWLVYFFILYIFVWLKFFEPTMQKIKGPEGG